MAPMKINLREIESGRREFNYELSPEETDLVFPDAGFPEVVRTRVRVTDAEEKYLLEVASETRAQLQCSRCLEPMALPLRVEFNVVLKLCPPATVVSKENGSEEDDLVLVSESETSYDITARVREALILALPLKPLCRDDCKGLCPRCGTDLNTSTCRCQEEKSDPRWSKLKELK